MTESTMRVLMTLDGIDVGGTETHVLSLAEEMINKGIGIVIISRGGSIITILQSITMSHLPSAIPLLSSNSSGFTGEVM